MKTTRGLDLTACDDEYDHDHDHEQIDVYSR